jgi:hypothetical protein
MTTLWNLTDEEVACLDGRCSPKTQGEVDKAKARMAARASMPQLTHEGAALVSDVVMLAKTEGQVIFMFRQVRSCRVCGKSAGYAKYKRSGRWHRKGDDDTDKPLTMLGVELASRSVNMHGSVHVGCCEPCFRSLQGELIKALEPIRAEIASAITGHASRFKRYQRRHCTSCGWRGHEGQLEKLPTLMGDGYYPGKCPVCGYENKFLGENKIKMSDGFEIIEVEAKPS